MISFASCLLVRLARSPAAVTRSVDRPPVLDVRRLRVLHAVSAYGSVTAAAAALGFHRSGRFPAAGRAGARGGDAADRAGRAGHRAHSGRHCPGRAHRRAAGPARRGRVRPGRAARAGGRAGHTGRVPVGRGHDSGRGVGRAGPFGTPGAARADRDGARGVAARRAAGPGRRGHRARIRPAATPARPALRAPRAGPRPGPPGRPRPAPRWPGRSRWPAWPASRSWPRAATPAARR